MCEAFRFKDMDGSIVGVGIEQALLIIFIQSIKIVLGSNIISNIFKTDQILNGSVILNNEF